MKRSASALLKKNSGPKRVKKPSPPTVLRVALDTIEAAEHLSIHGFAVIPIIEFEKPASRAEIIDSIKDDVAGFPEFLPGTTERVLGGFSALGNPSSFHCMSVRRIRETVHHIGMGVLRDVNPVLRGEQVVDRLMVRPVGVSPTAESFHRDESTLATPGDTLYGGWIQMNEEPSTFSCIPGTHRPPTEDPRGFAKIDATEFAGKGVHVIVPAGHMLMFNETLVHEVLPSKHKTTLYRLFLGWRLTANTSPLIDHCVFREQGVVRIKSGQTPPMYAKLHVTNWIERLVQFSTAVNPRCIEDYTFSTGKHAGETYQIVHRFMRSLTEYGLPLYSPYTEEELKMHTPQRLG